MKSFFKYILAFMFVLLIVACTPTDETPIDEEPIVEEPVQYTVTFDSKGGSAVAAQTVDEDGKATKPADPTKEGFTFVHWYLENEDLAFDFNQPITADITLSASWEEIEEEEPIEEPTNEEKIQADIDALEQTLYVDYRTLALSTKGSVNGSTIKWTIPSKYIASNGIILPVLPSDDIDLETEVLAEFTLGQTKVNYAFPVQLYRVSEVELTVERDVPFTNVTTEYDVPSGDLTLLFEEGGSVPYVRVVDFFNLLRGFIDPELDITFETDETSLFIQYFYYDEEEDYTYDLNITIDAVTNTFTTPDPGFYWAYVYSTSTNYGRHITYVRDHEGAYFNSGNDLVYDLTPFNMDVVMYEGEVVVPYYIANQLFAGSSYYNVYYNYDGLYGIYALPSSGTDEYRAIRNSSVNNTAIPKDLAIHSFNFLAFAMDNFYGLKGIMNVDTYYNLLFSKKNQLLTTTARDYETALFELINKSIDEPHTSYGYPGYYNRASYAGPQLTALGQMGPRGQSFYNDGLYATDDAIAAKWGITGSGWAAYDPKRPLYWFLDPAKTSVVLSLDDFNTSDIQESATWDQSIVNGIIKQNVENYLPQLNGGNKYFFYNQSNLEDNIMELLVKGLTESDVEDYKLALQTVGFEPSTVGFSKVDGDKQYNASVKYDATYKLAYLGFYVEDVETANGAPLTATIMDLIIDDSAVYMEMQLELITSLAPDLESIILDISWNTGGNVGALYRVVGFITDQPFAVSSIDGDTGGESTSYVKIEGVPTYAHLNWGLLITKTSFSAANSLATIFQDNQLGPIIGVQSGGGASSITPILLPNGTAFTMSSNNINAYRTGAGTEEDPYVYHSNEFGIVPTHPVPMNQIYDNAVLLGILVEVYS